MRSPSSHGRVLLTGGSGRLGAELRRLCPAIVAPPHQRLDVTDPVSIQAALSEHTPTVIVHAAAYTDVARAEIERSQCWMVNVMGTRHIVQAAAQLGISLVYISTDYVFDGVRGMYHECDTPGPVRNYYALTKLVAEQLVRLHPAHLVVRTSFRPREWPYPVAFSDVATSQDYVDVIAPDIALAIQQLEHVPYHTLHIATERKTVYDLARRRRPDVRAGSKREAAVDLPDDISLDVSRWSHLRPRLLALQPEVQA